MASSAPISAAARPLTNGSAAAAGAKLVDFLNKAVTPFHAVAEVVSRLNAAGYTALEEGAEWPELAAGAKHYVVRNQSSVVAFALGGKFQLGSGFKIIGAHTDSPNLALKPQTKSTKHGFEHVGVQLYGGGLWHTWFDRDLTVAGRILVKDGATKLKSKLVHVPRPILRIPNLAIHLQSAAERESFAPNKESHTSPLLGTSLAESVSSQLLADTPDNQSKGLFSLIAATAGVTAADIVDFDLSIVDTQPAVVGGAYNEFVWGPRIDNLFSCFTGVEALVATDGSLAAEEGVRMIAFFDHEEVGSESTHGAAGSLIPDLVDRIQKEHRARSVANSILLSVDCAHGCHPNYADKHEAVNRPSVQAGPVIKYNANQRYATNGHTAAWLAAVAALADVPVQKFAVKNDSPCGTTIGPILSSLSGIKAADIGAPMLSMHSIREMCGTADIVHMTNLLTAFFERSAQVVMEN